MRDFILDQAREHLPLLVSEDWAKRQAHMREAIDKFTSAQEAVLWAQQHGHSGFDHRVVAGDGVLIEKKERLIRERFPRHGYLIDVLEDSPFSQPDTLMLYQGRRVSNIHYWHLNQMLACLEWLDPTLSHILEIGGGYGALARLFKLVFPAVPYTIYDLPGSLFFAECYLRLSFPTMRFSDVPGVADFNLVQALSLSSLRSFTHSGYVLVVQAGGFQEMPEETVNRWMAWLEKKEVNGLYSLNYTSTPVVGKEPEGGYQGWDIVHREENPPIVSADAGSNWTELCLRRKP